jgi:hypothetical protein
MGMLALVRSGLAKLPSYNGTVRRTIAMSTESADSLYVVGEVITEKGFLHPCIPLRPNSLPRTRFRRNTLSKPGRVRFQAALH